MILTPEDARDIVWEDHEDWQKIRVDIVDSTRWSIVYEGVFLHIPSNKHYLLGWRKGATEMQEEQPFEYEDEVEAKEVELVEVVVKQWREVN